MNIPVSVVSCEKHQRQKHFSDIHLSLGLLEGADRDD